MKNHVFVDALIYHFNVRVMAKIIGCPYEYDAIKVPNYLIDEMNVCPLCGNEL